MLVVFEVHLAPGADPSNLFSEEMLKETQAQIMTLDEARAVGFQHPLKEQEGLELRLIACSKRDAGWVHRTLEASNAVAAFRMHDIG